MPYWLESDTFADDPVWEALAGDGRGHDGRVDALQAAYARLKAKASHLRTDGYLTEATALRYCRNRRQLLDQLCTAVLDRPPLLHRPTDKCECMHAVWVDGYAYRIHEFLKRNPSRKENDRHRAQRRDLADPRLRAAVVARDGGCCRYCGSGPLSAKAGRSKDRRKVLCLDHVDPDAPAGIGGRNLVVCCGRCNEEKGHRTPDEADMVLLPEPAPETARAWLARPQLLADRPPYPGPSALVTPPADQTPISLGRAPEQRPNQNENSDPISGPTADPIGDRSHQNQASTPPVRPQNDRSPAETAPNEPSGGSGSGRVGTPDLIQHPGKPHSGYPGQPPRDPSHPDVYHHRSRDPGPPDYAWPPGSVPVTPRPEQEEPPR